MKLSSLVDAVKDIDEEIVITKNGTPAAIMINPDEYESWKETHSILADEELMAEIKKGLKNLKKKKAKIYTLDELFE